MFLLGWGLMCVDKYKKHSVQPRLHDKYWGQVDGPPQNISAECLHLNMILIILLSFFIYCIENSASHILMAI